MSILPSENLGSESSSSPQFGSQNPNPNHGSEPPLSSSSSPPPSLLHSSSDPVAPLSGHHPSVSPAPTSQDSAGPPRKMSEVGSGNGKRITSHQKPGVHFQRNAAGRAGAGRGQHRGSPRGQQTSGSPNSQGGTPQSAGRKIQMVNGNHLLNFHYDPISRSQPRAPPPRRPYKRKPYNKDLFLQANYKFVMLDSGNCSPESLDPDNMLRWEDIICVKYSTPLPLHCPICLEDLLCPQMTSCGHIFCFPCILRYLLMGEDDNIGECSKKCPLCFMMISSKDLYTIYIENVKQHSVGDIIEFMLLTRQKDSLTLSVKGKQAIDTMEGVHDSFSKFTFTSDADLSVRKAISELDNWLAKAESGLVDDMEKLPYVCAAMELLEGRKKYWNDHRFSNLSIYPKNEVSHAESPPTADYRNGYDGIFVPEKHFVSAYDDSTWTVTSKEPHLDQLVDEAKPHAEQEKELSSSYDSSKAMKLHADDFRDKKDKDSYDFYQAVDGQHLILHPLNMKCLLHHYVSYDALPQRISGRILQLETVTQSEAMRRRYRFLSHFSLTTTFQLCEIDLSGILPPSALSPFEDEIKNREKQRNRIAIKEQREKAKAEAAAAAAHYVPITFNPAESHDYFPSFSMDDFEALGSSTVTSSSPPTVGERPLFSNVARLGFAAGGDSPALSNGAQPSKADTSSGSSTGLQDGGAVSFANIISRAKPVEPKVSELGKKGKKPARVLLSTSGGRRY